MLRTVNLIRCGVAGLLIAVCAVDRSVAQDLPNIVLILPDDHAWEDHGFMGHEAVRTPNIDKLAPESPIT
jgi:hypothetical protein